MVTLQDIYLVTRNARDKVQQVQAKLLQEGNTFVIQRITGQYLGVQTEQPELIIEKGKAKRTILQQAELQFNSIINKYMDKGYKKLTELTKTPFENISESEMNILVPSVKTDSSGFLKPMLAKDSNKCQTSVLNKKLLCSKKLNGVRCLMQFSNEEIHAISRGGKEYNVPTTLIREELTKFFEDHPSVILDGELYNHGHHLQELSGIARLKEWEDRCEILEYWIYDIADSTKTFEERLILLKELKELFSDAVKVKVIDHEETNSFKEIQELHNEWVSEGYEGLVARKPTSTYQFGKRGSDMIKVKEYMEQEFEIIDYRDGLRDEDFCFILETEDNKSFAAKPIGSKELKEQYLKDIDTIIGKKGTVKFFEWSKDGVPQQPIFQVIRDYE
jgi:ATP-dependent DNA ligase